jgi:Tol biopolymer transport system component
MEVVTTARGTRFCERSFIKRAHADKMWGLLNMGKPPPASSRMAVILLISLTLLLLFPATATAKTVNDYFPTPSPIQRTLDAYGKGPFCAGCHFMQYPLPPETLEYTAPPATYPVGATEAEPGVVRLTDSPGRDVQAFYSPKENKIVWATDSLGNWTLWVMNDDGSDKKQLTSENVISGWPSWSPDGKELTYWSYDPASKAFDIWKMRNDGTSKVRLTTDGTFKGTPMWSPRGDRIAYTANQTGNLEVYVINTDGTGKKQITTGHTPVYWVESRTTWHPDGQRLYYQVTTFPLPPNTVPDIQGDVAFVEIFSVNVDTGYEVNLTPKLHENVRSVSPDGKLMACISLRTNNYGLWVMNGDGTNQTRLTWTTKGDRAPRISPDGKRIAYWSLTSGNPNIWLINVDGSNNTQLTISPYYNWYPSWSPDGRRIAFESDRGGSFDIWALTLDQPLVANAEFETCAVKGGTGKALVKVRLKDSSTPVQLEKVSLHFDWDPDGKYNEVSTPLPKILSGGGDVYQATLNFTVPKNTTLGYHFYDVRVQYSNVKGGAAGASGVYEQSAGDLEVGIPEHTQCDRLYVELGGKLEQLHGQAINRSYALGSATSEVTLPLKGYFDYLQKKDAESFLKANDEFNEGRYLYLAGDYGTALTRFQKVKTLANQASLETAEQGPSGLWVLVALLPVALIVTLLAFHVRRTRRA